MLGLLRANRLLLPAAMTLAGVLLGIALGTWQMQRLAWKTELIETIEARTSAPPIPAEAWANLKCRPVDEVGLELSCDYMKVSVRGTFDHARERHVFISVPRQANGIGGPGYWVFTPLMLTGGGIVAVNRGFVPESVKRPEQRPDSLTKGEVAITGLFRSAEPRASFSGRNDSAANVWYVRSPAEMYGAGIKGTQSAGPDPAVFYIDQTSAPANGQLPMPLAGKIDLPNRHFEYALTWFSLSATLLAVFVVYARSALLGGSKRDAG